VRKILKRENVKRNMKKILLVLILTFLVLYLNAQQINTSSGNIQFADFSAEWILGGSLIDNSILSGNDENILAVETPNINIIDVYPTITKDFLTITAKDSSNRHLNFKIINYLGVNILKGIIDISTPFELNVKHLAAGHYIIIFSSSNDKSFYLAKQFIKL
jgi:hypothetical protein